MAVTPVFGNALVTVGENIYSLGGQYLENTGVIFAYESVIVFNFTLNRTLQEYIYEPSSEDPIGNYCQGFLLPDSKTIVVMGIDINEEARIGFDFFNTVDMKWEFTNRFLNTSLFPPYRKYSSSVISPGSDALYLIGGSVVDDAYNIPVGIIRYDISNRTSVVDLAITYPSLNFTLIGSSADMLPNGIVVLAFGVYGNGSLYSSSQVLLFDTNINEIRVQPVNGIAPNPRALASSTLGPDKTTIYYFGGQDETNLINQFDGTVYNDLVILDTNTWSWVPHKVTGVTPWSTVLSGMTVFGQNEIFISTGQSFNFYSQSVSVLKNVPGLGESIEFSNLQWFTNYDVFDNLDYNKGLSSGAIAGIVIARFDMESKGYTDSTGTKVQFSFFAEPLQFGDLDRGVIYIDFYPPGYNPNLRAQGIANETKLSEEDYSKWLSEETSSNSIDTILLRQGVRSTASYTLTTVKTMRRNDGWNYIGFSSTYDDSMDVKTSYKDSPQSLRNMPGPGAYDKVSISRLVVQPDAFVLTTNKEQKVFTLLNAFAQAGGVLGLFIAVQTILFGFRPQSPWGIVHRWSFGNLKIKLTDRLANYFNMKGTPVPLVNPVSTRLNHANGYSYFSNSSDTYIPAELDVPSAVEGIAEQENRMHHMEERLQIMERLLRSYYLNAEVFESLDEAVKRGHQEKRRSSLRIDKDKNTDSVLQNDASSQDFDIRLGDVNRLSPTLFQMQRGTYQSNLASQAPLEVYDDEHKIGGK
ncbi:hypothetical protein HPULCUR_002079 [Helicostylum pulchrum]|uniref:Uncharacterized protein n=1 Tax=Helicostylum pulchrum TaxID=562976 RepID=A0ABP9XPH6_9FUNG